MIKNLQRLNADSSCISSMTLPIVINDKIADLSMNDWQREFFLLTEWQFDKGNVSELMTKEK